MDDEALKSGNVERAEPLPVDMVRSAKGYVGGAGVDVHSQLCKRLNESAPPRRQRLSFWRRLAKLFG